MITFDNVSVSYGTTKVLQGVSLSFPRGCVSVVIGPSGCGKSTLIKSINRLVEPECGTITLDGRNLKSIDHLMLRRGMGYVIQNVGLFPHMTVAQNIAAVPTILKWDKSRIKRRVDELLRLVRLEPTEYAGKYPVQLSGGEAQRVGVARALGADPPVLLMDEAFGATDPITREILQDEFIGIQRRLKKTVVFVTHDMDEALRMADHLFLLKDGKLIQSGPPIEILKRPANEFVEKFFGQDREIKKLVLYTADQLLKSADSSNKIPAPGETVWELDHRGRPESGVCQRAGKRVRRKVAGFTVYPHSSVKECLSAILGLGLTAVPVVDETGTLMGEVRYADIEMLSDDD